MFDLLLVLDERLSDACLIIGIFIFVRGISMAWKKYHAVSLGKLKDDGWYSVWGEPVLLSALFAFPLFLVKLSDSLVDTIGEVAVLIRGIILILACVIFLLAPKFLQRKTAGSGLEE